MRANSQRNVQDAYSREINGDDQEEEQTFESPRSSWKRQLPPGSPSDIAILRRCDTLAEYVQYLENKYGVDMTESHWKQIKQVETDWTFLRYVRMHTCRMMNI